MKIEHLMTRAVKTCRAEDSLARAAQIFWEQDCGVVPVVDAENRVLGMLTDRDVCMATWLTGQPLTQLRVADSMSRKVYGCRPDDAPATALSVVRARRVRRLPVMDEQGRLVGIVSLNDLVRFAAQENALLSPQELVSTIAAVCESRARVPASRAPAAMAMPRAVMTPPEPVPAVGKRT